MASRTAAPLSKVCPLELASSAFLSNSPFPVSVAACVPFPTRSTGAHCSHSPRDLETVTRAHPHPRAPLEPEGWLEVAHPIKGFSSRLDHHPSSYPVGSSEIDADWRSSNFQGVREDFPDGPLSAISRDSRPWASETSSRKQGVLRSIRQTGVIACLTADQPDIAYDAATAALEAGIRVLELTTSTPDVFQVVSALASRFTDASIGVGTVLSEDQAHRAIRAGATFLMSPHLDEELIRKTSRDDVLFIPGVMTPTEILRARNLGCLLVKLFPAAAAGGVDTVLAFKRIAPDLGLVPARAISLDLVSVYLQAGSPAVVLSGVLFNKELLASGRLEEVSERCASALGLAREAIS